MVKIKKEFYILLIVLFLLIYPIYAKDNEITGKITNPPINTRPGGCSDLNNDGSVNSADLNIFQQVYLKTSSDPNYRSEADFDDDNDIDYIDLKCFQEDFGKSISCPTNSRVCGCVNGCADLDRDGAVTNLDLIVFQQSNNACIGNPLYREDSDFNQDGCINSTQNSFDFLCFQERFGDLLTCNIQPPTSIGGCSDLNNDGTVSITDIIYVQQRLGITSSDPSFNSLADFDDNNKIDSIDLGCVKKEFGLQLSCQTSTKYCDDKTLGIIGGCSDFDYDGSVSLGDSVYLQQRINIDSTNPNFDYRADFNDDSRIDDIDTACFKSDFGNQINCPSQTKVCGCNNGCADLNRDGIVSLEDLSALTSLNGVCSNSGSYRAEADFDKNGCIESNQESLDSVCIQKQIGNTLTCGTTPVPYRIKMTANSQTAPADGSSTILLTAALLDTSQNDAPVISNKVVFSIVSGQGSFISPTTVITNSNGEATITLKSVQSTSDITTIINVHYLSDPQISSTMQVTFKGQSSPGGSPNGGGTPSGGGSRRCRPDWDCTEWASCSIQGTKTRVCTDLENCRTNTNKPATTQSCTYVPRAGGSCQSSFSCTEWNDCDEGTQSRTCVDIRGCSESNTETRPCVNMCNDEVKNNNEIDIDCGGDCKPCGRYGTKDITKDLGIPILAVLGVLLIISYFLRKKSEMNY